MSGVLRRAGSLLGRTIQRMIDNEGYRYAAEAAFYLIFSIFPFLFLLFVLLGGYGHILLPRQWLTTVSELFSNLIPPRTYQLITGQLQNLTDREFNNELIVSLVLFFWPASNVFYAYIDAVCKSYNQVNTRGYFGSRLLSFGLLFLCGAFIFVASLLLSLGGVILGWIREFELLDGLLYYLTYLRVLVSFALITPSLALLYYFSPVEKVRSIGIWPGAIFGTVLWVVISYLYGVYISYYNAYQALYGVLGGAMLLLMWMYLTSLAVVMGAEFNVVLSELKTGKSLDSAPSNSA